MAADDTVAEKRRERLVTWDDPQTIRDAGLSMDGLSFFQAIVEGRLPQPPIAHTMGMRMVSAREGHVVFEGEPDESVYNPIGMVHGGYAATILDSAIGCSIKSRLPAGVSFTTLEIKVSYLKALSTETGTVHTETTVVSLGRRVATAESRLLDARGRLYATASSTCLILQPDAKKEQ